jgi:hypothetical protein
MVNGNTNVKTKGLAADWLLISVKFVEMLQLFPLETWNDVRIFR